MVRRASIRSHCPWMQLCALRATQFEPARVFPALRCSPLLAWLPLRIDTPSPFDPDSVHLTSTFKALGIFCCSKPSCRAVTREGRGIRGAFWVAIHTNTSRARSTRRGHLLPRCPRGCISNRASKVPRIRTRPGPPEIRSQPCVAVSKPQIPGRVAWPSWHTCAASPQHFACAAGFRA
jgi:hypothetical protein